MATPSAAVSTTIVSYVMRAPSSCGASPDFAAGPCVPKEATLRIVAWPTTGAPKTGTGRSRRWCSGAPPRFGDSRRDRRRRHPALVRRRRAPDDGGGAQPHRGRGRTRRPRGGVGAELGRAGSSAALGVLAAGAWLVPLNTRLKGPEAAFILEQTDARLLFAPPGVPRHRLRRFAPVAAPGLRALEHTVELPLPGEFTGPGWDRVPGPRRRGAARAGPGTSSTPAEPDDVSDVIFTSGTTGIAEGRDAPPRCQPAGLRDLQRALRPAGARPVRRHRHRSSTASGTRRDG